jgi:hypothetical protein
MKKEARVPRAAGDLEEALRDQMLLMVSHCSNYDEGRRAFALELAGALRLLLHKTGKSMSLLEQLGLRHGDFYAVSPRMPDDLFALNVLPTDGLLITNFSPQGIFHKATTRPLGANDSLDFNYWWSGAVLGRGTVTMSRMEIVTAVANTDGGGHVDPTLEEKYAAFRSGQLMGWELSIDRMGLSFRLGATASPDVNYFAEPQFACLRTIAHEVLSTLNDRAPWAFACPYVPPPWP